MVDSFGQRKIHLKILAGAKLMKCDACQARARVSLRPVVSGRRAESGAGLQMDNFYCKQPTLNIYIKGALLVDMALRVTVVRILKTSLRAERVGNVPSVEARTMLQACWFKYPWAQNYYKA